MASSRIFVKGLPPSLTEDDFRNHFAKRYTVTDVKLLQARRIGYVGFKLASDAAAAIKYFNKTFIRMSKISVEIANDNSNKKLTPHPTSRRTESTSLNSTNQAENSSLKRKRDERPAQDDPKFQEYLGLLEPPPKLKYRQGNDAVPLSDTIATKDIHGGPEDNSKHKMSVKTPANKTDQDGSKERSEPPSVAVIARSQDETGFNGDVQNDRPTSETVEEDDPREESQQLPKSDAEWMRSRTSRLLGLLDDDEEQEQQAREAPVTSSPSPAPQEHIDEDVVEIQPETEDVSDKAVEHSFRHLDDIDRTSKALRESGRLFLRNLPYTVTEDDLRELFAPFGSIEEVHVSMDSRTGIPKGFAFVQYEDFEHAVEAFEQLDGTAFQGRLLHILPAARKRETKLDEFALSKLPLKKQKQIQRKAAASSTTFNWNSMYMNADAVLSSIADRLGVPKSEVLDPTSSDAAVKQAQAETHIIQETKAYFKVNGVDLDAFQKKERGETTILVKNFPYGTKAEDLKKLFTEHGDVLRVLMPPSGTIAIVEFKIATQARTAFHSLAYRKFRDSILFLEKAPKDLLKTSFQATNVAPSASEPRLVTSDLLHRGEEQAEVDTTSLYVRNISFNTSDERFVDLFKPLDGFISARINTKPDPKNPGQRLSMGFGFLEFRTAEQAKNAQAAMNDFSLDGHRLVIKASQKPYDAAEAQKRLDDAKKKSLRKSKIIIKNLPFEASNKDIRNLFKAYGQLRAVRVPKKFDSSRKGFAFAEFTTAGEAENAMDALRDTHLLGRRLILEYAAGEIEDPEKEIEKLQQKVGRQINSVALQQLTTAERRKLDMAEVDEAGS